MPVYEYLCPNCKLKAEIKQMLEIKSLKLTLNGKPIINDLNLEVKSASASRRGPAFSSYLKILSPRHCSP